MNLETSILSTIGNTNLIKLQRVVPKESNIYMKCEWQNPTGSMKDRMAQSMIANAEKDGRLPLGGTVVEYTGGSTGASLALICAVKDYRLKIVTSDVFSQDKLDHMTSLGAELTIIPSHGKGITKDLVDTMIEKARQIRNETNGYFTDQLRNSDAISGYENLGHEIIQQLMGKVDAFVHSVGSSASLQGVAKILRKNNPDVQIIASEPEESAFLSKGESGSHGIDGIGIGFKPPLWYENLADQFISVSTADAKEMVNRLAKEEGIFVGTSSGANVVASIKLSEQIDDNRNIVTLGVDTGLKYLSHK